MLCTGCCRPGVGYCRRSSLLTVCVVLGQLLFAGDSSREPDSSVPCPPHPKELCALDMASGSQKEVQLVACFIFCDFHPHCYDQS